MQHKLFPTGVLRELFAPRDWTDGGEEWDGNRPLHCASGK